MKKDNEVKLSTLIRRQGISNVARKMQLSAKSVSAWVKLDSVPQRKVLKLSEVLDEDPWLIQSMVKPITYKIRRVRRPAECLDTILAAYKGEPYEIKPPLTSKSLIHILATYGDKVPLLVETMKKLMVKEITNKEAAEILGITTQAVYVTRRMNGLPASHFREKKPEPPLGPYKMNALKIPGYIKPVIEGTMSKGAAASKYGVPDRTFSRYLANALGGLTLKQLAHWPQSFRMAFAHEIDKNLPRLVPHWWKMMQEYGWKRVKAEEPMPPATDWRLMTTKRMLYCVLNEGLSVKELGELRGSEPVILHKLFDIELKPLGLTFSQVVQMSIWHQMAVMDMVRMHSKP